MSHHFTKLTWVRAILYSSWSCTQYCEWYPVTLIGVSLSEPHINGTSGARVCHILSIVRVRVCLVRRAIIQCRHLFCVHNSTFQHAMRTWRSGQGRPAKSSQPSTFRIHNVSTLSLFNVKWMPRAPLPRSWDVLLFSLLPAWMLASRHHTFAKNEGVVTRGYMDATSMDATRCSELSRDREERLWRRRKCERARRTAETAEQRAHRLWQRRERDRAGRALQNSERRERESCSVCALPVMTD